MSERCRDVLREVRAAIGRIVRQLAAEEAASPRRRRLLDVGCWEGELTGEWAALYGADALGIEIFEAPRAAARARGVDVAALDLEVDAFPWADGSVDLVIANQVLEHLKNVLIPLAEIHRVLSPGGTAILSVPNLGSLHNRLLLAAGRQPTSIRTLGPHVRGFTFGEFRSLLSLGGAYDRVRASGAGFHPLPATIARPLARALPACAHTTIVVARKARGTGGGAGAGRAAANPWREAFEQRELQTFYAEPR